MRAGLLDVDRELARKGWPRRRVAFGFSFAILFREGVEAVLLIAILLGSLAAGSAPTTSGRSRWACWRRVGATAVTFALATLVIDIAPVSRELLEAITALLAVDRPHRRELLARSRAWSTSGAWSSCARAWRRRWPLAPTAAFVGLGFTAVYREGFETVLFYQALALFAQGLELWVALGAVTAAIALGFVGYAILRLGKQLPLKPMLVGGRGGAAAAVGRVRRQRGPLAAGRRYGRRAPGLLAAAAGLPGRAHRPASDRRRASSCRR